MAPSIWLILFTLLAAIVFKIGQVIWSHYLLCKCFKQVPGWPTHWLYGNFHQKIKGDYYVTRSRWASENKIRVSREWWGPSVAALIIHHPDVWKELINKPKGFEVYSLLEPWLGLGLLLAGGKRWARNRKLLTAAFHFETLKPYLEVYNECTDVLVEKWTESSAEGRPVLVHQDISGLTLDVLLKCSFSFTSNCQEKCEKIPYIRAVKDLSSLSTSRFFSVWLNLLHNDIYLNFTSEGRKFKQAAKLVHEYAENVIRERKLAIKDLQIDATVDSKNILRRALQKDRKYLDFLDILLTARDEEGHGLTDLEIRYEVDTFMFEGHDTTAHGLSWTLYCLAKHPEHQEKCREEVNQVLGSRSHLEYEDLSKLTYIQWCIKESLRLYPPVFGFVRKLQEDMMIEGHMFPRDTLLGVMVLDIHYNAEFWKDPEVFDPLRFQPERISNQNPYAYMPFSAGPRNCIGQNFAMNEMRVAIASIVRKFKLSLIKEVEHCPAILYGFKDDIQLSIELCN